MYEVCFKVLMALSDSRERLYISFLGNIDKSLWCLYEQNKSNETIWRLIINTVTAHMPIDEIPIVRLFLYSV